MVIGSWWSVLWATFVNPKGFKKLSRNWVQYIVGGITIEWASIETALDGLALVAYHSGGNEFAASLPRALNRKIQFMKIAFRKLPAFQPYAKEGLRFLERIETLSDDRHWAIHGTVMEHTGNLDFEIVVSKASRFDHYFKFEQRTTSVPALIEVWEQSGKLAVELFQFGRPMCEHFLQNDTHNSAGR